MILYERGKQNFVKSGFRYADSQNSFLEPVITRKFLFRGGNLFVCDRDAPVQFFALGSQSHAFIRACEQYAAQIPFEIFYRSRNVRLFGIERVRGSRDIAVFRNKIKSFVVFEIRVHFSHFSPYQKSMTSIVNIYFTDDDEKIILYYVR